MIVRGSTPTHVFVFPQAISLPHIKEVFITYVQDGRVVIDKRLADAEINTTTRTIEVQLSQDNTMGFVVYRKPKLNLVNIQLKIAFVDGTVCHSRVMREKVCNQLLDGCVYDDGTFYDDESDDKLDYDGGELA